MLFRILKWVLGIALASIIFGVVSSVIVVWLQTGEFQVSPQATAFFRDHGFTILISLIVLGLLTFGAGWIPDADEPLSDDPGSSPVSLTPRQEAGERPEIKQSAPPPALHQLPPAPRDFTGRQAELDTLHAAMNERGLALSGLQGMGGIGKTALGLVVAHRIKERYPDAQFFLDLKGTTTPLSMTDVMQHVIRAYHPDSKLPDTEKNKQEGQACLSCLSRV